MINQFMNTLFKLIAQVGYLKQVTEYIDQFKYQLLDQQQTVSKLWGIGILAKKKNLRTKGSWMKEIYNYFNFEDKCRVL